MRNLSINNTSLTRDKRSTFLSAASAAAASTLTVESIVGFAVDKVLLIGEFGNEQSELILTHDSTAPSGSTVTLKTNLVFAHSQGTKVYILDWNQIEISWSETATGSKAVLDTIAIQADQTETLYIDEDKATGYYFIRFKNSVDTTYSSYSDPIPYGDFGDNTVAKAIQYALKRNKLDDFPEYLDHDFLIDEINNCLRYIRGKKKKWTDLQDFNYELGQTARGEFSIALPTDVWHKSHKSILSVRVGDYAELTYKDKKEFDELLEGVARTTVASDVTTGDTEITLTNSYDFDDEGSVMIDGQVIEYDDKDNATKELEEIPASGTGSVTADIIAGANVWQGSYEEGTPEYFTVYDGYLYWYPLTDSARPIMNIVADFWTEAPEIDSDSDTLDIYRFEMVKLWLAWIVRAQIRNDGIRDFNDGDYVSFREILADAIKQDVHGQKYKTVPSLNKIEY